VDDVDAYVGKVVDAGGSLHRPASDIPGILRFAVVADPQGAAFVLFTPFSDTPPPPPIPDKPGYCAWRELMAGDGESAFAFYSRLFGWTKGATHDMGPMGIYQLFVDQGETVGGMMTKPPQAPRPHWNFYFRVDSVGAAVDRLKAAGGTVLMGPIQVPSNDWVVQGQDPQGAMFALISSTP